MTVPRIRHVRRAGRRAALAVALALLAGPVTGCATIRSTIGGYAKGPDGITLSQFRLRRALATGDFPVALAWREDDALLGALTRATSAYYASQFQRAATLLDSAALLADDRITASVSRDALALLTNDIARPYQPRPTERLFVAYYGMLSYARLESWEEAAVEARRMVSLIAQRDANRDDGERALHAALEHLAGAVFERAGRGGEAQVAYRAAHQMLASAPERPARLAAGEGEVLVVLERGFVAHRVNEQIDIFFDSDDDDSLRTDREPRWHGPGSDTASDGRRHRHRHGDRDHDDDGYWLAVSFPVLHHSSRAWRESVQLTAEGAREATRIATVLDDAAAVDERRDRVAMMARAVARASAKYAVTKAVKDSKGDAAGKLANIGAGLLERADVRSWHLLPQEVQLFRMVLPAGSRTLRLEIADGDGPRTVEIGPVSVRAGAVTIVPHRVWRDGAPVPLVAAR